MMKAIFIEEEDSELEPQLSCLVTLTRIEIGESNFNVIPFSMVKPNILFLSVSGLLGDCVQI